MSMLERYYRAVRLTAPKIAAEWPGVAREGYWVDDNLFYFLAERFEPSLGRTVEIPSIANCDAQSVEEVISLDVLAGLLSDKLGQTVNVDALSFAEFDMPDRDTLAVSVAGRDHLVDLRQRCVTKSSASLEVPALYSPDGRYACFVKGHDLWLKERSTGVERPLTTDGAAHHCYGQKSEMGLRALSYRRRPIPVGLWSPDSQWLLTRRIDERSVPDLALIQHAPPCGGRPVLHSYKCAFPGDPLPVATYVAIHVTSGRVVAFYGFPALDVMAHASLSQMAWFGETNTAWFVRFDRYFNQADLISLDLSQGTGRIVLNELAASGYLTLQSRAIGTPNVRTLVGSSEVIWFSERDGWGHLYLYDGLTGMLKNRITSGQWRVRDIVHVDEKRRKVVLLAGGIDPEADPAQRCLCAVNLDGSGFEVLLTHDGDIYVPVTQPCGLDQDRPFRPSMARAGISPAGRFGVVRHASVDRGNVTEIVDLRMLHGFTIASARPASDKAPLRRFTALAADGVTRLHGVMFFPSDFDECRRYPVIDYIYPGPHAAHQPQSFRSVHSALAMSLSELGFVTIMLDTRCLPIGSRSFHQAGYGATLEPQLTDHAVVVRQLCERHPFIDAKRVGMIGCSAGGAATVRALCDHGDIFRVGVAVCGVHDSSLYSTVWSDKYRGPGTREKFAEQANNAVSHKLKGKLLLISGDMDENVHVSHTLSLADSLIRANRDFDLLIVPNEGHYLLETNGYVQRRAWDYFVCHLLGETPPPDFEIRFESYEVTQFNKHSRREVVQA